jgi:hypothetical protein
VVGLSDREIGAEIITSCRLGDREAFRAIYDSLPLQVEPLPSKIARVSVGRVEL